MMKLELTDQEMQILNAAIVELPFKVVAPVVHTINRQIEAQRKVETMPVEQEEAG